jgi:hypothetical protein
MYKEITRDDLNDRKIGSLWARKKEKYGEKYVAWSGNFNLGKYGLDIGELKFQMFENKNTRNENDPRYYFYASEDQLHLLKIPVDPIKGVNWDKYNIPEFK